MPEGPNSEKKIIIDEDWKSQVEAERAKECGCGGHHHAADDHAAAKDAANEAVRKLPPPSLLFVVDTLAYRAMISLGLLPSPLSEEPTPQFEQAQHAIDLIDILFEKTTGNRTAEETEAIEAILHQLRMAFVSLKP